MRPFDSYRSNVYSQNGEDGVLLEILARVGVPLHSSLEIPRWCVEFGAWDGKHFSNTFALVERHCWHAVFIEGDSKKYLDLEVTAARNPTIIPVLAFVDHNKGSKSSLDCLLGRTPVPKEFDLLSIDIDSYDLEVWESFVEYSPKIVIIEINSSLRPGVLAWNTEKMEGASFSSTLNVGRGKGYSLVCHTGNMIFVRDDLAFSAIQDNIYFEYPELLFDDSWVERKAPNATSYRDNGIRVLFSKVFNWISLRLRKP